MPGAEPEKPKDGKPPVPPPPPPPKEFDRSADLDAALSGDPEEMDQ